MTGINRQQGEQRDVADRNLVRGSSLDMRSCVKNWAFSTLEVLVAVAVVIILAMIVLGVGRRLKTQAQEKLARSTIEILVTAITQYHDFWDVFPDPCLPGLSGGISRTLRAENLYRQLDSTPSSKTFCEKIDATMIGDYDVNGDLEFLDPWGQPLDYRYSSGDSFPVVESVGPDGDPCTTADNISSRNM